MATTREIKGLLVTVGGLARAASSDVGPLPLCESTGVPQPASGVTRFETPYAPVLRNIQIGSTSVSPLSGETRQGALTFDIVLSDRRYPEIARFLFAQPTTPIAGLLAGTSFDAGDTTFTVATGSQSAALGAYIDEVVYLRGMALRIEDVNGATDVVTVYDERTNPNGGAYPTLATGTVGALGHAMTYIEDVPGRTVGAEPPYPDDEVWAVNPFLRERPVLLYSSDGVSVERQMAIYIIDTVALSEDGTFARVSCLDVLEVLKGRKLNERAVRMQITGATIWPDHVTLAADVQDGPESFDDSVYDGTAAGTPYNNRSAVIQANKSVYVSLGGYTLGYEVTGPVMRGVMAPNPSFRSDAPRSADELVGKSAWEILVSTPRLETVSGEHPFYSSDLGDVARHPLDLMQCHVGTLTSRLPDHWRTAFAPRSWFDGDELARIRNNVYPDVTAPGLFAGKDGKAVAAMQYLWESFAAMLGGAIAVNASGQITVRCLLDVSTVGTTPITSSTLLTGRGKVTDMSRDFDRALAEVGPGMDGVAGRIRVRGDIARSRYRYATQEFEFHCLPAWFGGRTFDPDDPAVATVTGILRRIAQWMRTLPFEHTLRVSGRYEIETGRTYRISGPGFRDAATGLTTAGYSFFGYVRERKVDPQTYQQDLRVVEMPEVTWIGMSCEVLSIASGDTLTVDASEFIDPLVSGNYEYTPGSTVSTAVSQIGVDLDDGRTVHCVIVSRRGVAVSQVFTADSVSTGGSTITATAAILAVGGGAYSRTAGDRVQLADYTDSTDSDMRADYGWVERDVYGL